MLYTQWTQKSRALAGRILILAGFLLVTTLGLAESRRGWLVYDDGNRISGELGKESGVFISDRFGEILFAPGDAVFQATEGGVPAPASEASSQPVGQTASAAPASAEEEKPNPLWWPDSWSITGSYMWKEDDEDKAYEVDLELAVSWEWAANELDLNFRAEYEYENGSVESNEQTGRLRWLNIFSDPFFSLAEGYLERDQFDVAGITYDTLLLQGAVGAGVQRQFSERLLGRVALLHNWVSIDILDSPEGGTVNAFSIFAEVRYDISKRAKYAHWVKVYFWEESTTGFESEAEIEYQLTRNFGLGLRHIYQDETPTLQSAQKNEIRFFSRLTF